VPLVKQGLPTILEYLISTHVLVVFMILDLVFCAVFFRSLFVTLSLFCWLLCCLLSFDLRIMITPLVSSFNSLYIKRNPDMFCFFFLPLFIYLFIYLFLSVTCDRSVVFFWYIGVLSQ
jgi:hypothetical protein